MFRPRFVLRAFTGEGNVRLSGEILTSLLTALTSINMVVMADAAKRGFPIPPLYSSGIRYVRDGESNLSDVGPEDWQDCVEALSRGEADCKSLACYRAAELRLSGIRAFAQFRWRDRDRGSLYHIVVQLPDGTIEDPSARLGMFDRRHS